MQMEGGNTHLWNLDLNPNTGVIILIPDGIESSLGRFDRNKYSLAVAFRMLWYHRQYVRIAQLWPQAK